jgi:transcriptional antiterminator RfaH
MSSWYLIYTKPAREAAAREHLLRQGFDVYFPRVSRRVRRSGRWIDQICALFPRYLFVGLDEQKQTLSPVRSTVGIAGVVKFGTQYSPVPPRVLRELQSRANPESGLHQLSQDARLAAGASVRIAGGPFDSIEGIFQRPAGADRVLVLLQVLGQAISVQLPLDAVAPACS